VHVGGGRVRMTVGMACKGVERARMSARGCALGWGRARMLVGIGRERLRGGVAHMLAGVGCARLLEGTHACGGRVRTAAGGHARLWGGRTLGWRGSARRWRGVHGGGGARTGVERVCTPMQWL
jgi:hypothetical protein